jgi:hypothetical protein
MCIYAYVDVYVSYVFVTEADHEIGSFRAMLPLHLECRSNVATR